MAYINSFVAHFRAVQQWGARVNASINLDVIDFALEVRCRHRYYTFHPQFVTAVDGIFSNTSMLTPATGGFAGWLPYRPLSYELSQDKLQFKNLATTAGLRTPGQWLLDQSEPAPEKDYVLKRSNGSYGNELSGPFRAGSLPSAQPQPRGRERGALFAEEYIAGAALKVWCWGRRPVFAHCQQPKTLAANGRASARHLVQAHLEKSGQTLEGFSEAHVLRDCLAYQGLTLDDVPPPDTQLLIDYRYGREASLRGLRSDDALPDLPQSVQEELGRAARIMASELRATFPAPVLYSLDGVLDEEGQVWWLEINSNPTMPPDGYATMLSELFGA